MVDDAEAAEEEAEEAAGYRIRNKNPTQRCGVCERWWMTRRRRRRRRDTESQTRTPHKDAGNKKIHLTFVCI